MIEEENDSSSLESLGQPDDTQTFRKNPDYKLNVKERGHLNLYFNAWFDHHLL